MSSLNTPNNSEYRVLARKYRPQNFDQLIGQEALVRTLKNAIETGRIAHAFMLTGVRGVGKTTTARIIAKALNYKGPEGTSGPTTAPTDDCALSRAIAEDRHPDVIEMDAATRTGVDDIREILDGVRYAPTEARYKIYIIDEVHMLSKQAFNALLKTLEEPPAHVKFIFATTEIRKVPITVLSRCQRFDLRRVDIPTLMAHFTEIAVKENVKAEEKAIAMIARAADGSVRDGLSILDQAIAMTGGDVTAAQVQAMMGLGDRARSMDLLEHALSGNIAEALTLMEDLYRSGGDPVVLIQDLLDLTHQLTRHKAIPAGKGPASAPKTDDIIRIQAMAQQLSMPTLGKTWQMLLKGLGEVQGAPNPQVAAEMVIMRLVYAADLPDPQDLLKKLKNSDQTASVSSAASSVPVRENAPVATHRPVVSSGGAAAMPAAETAVHNENIMLHTLEDMISLLRAHQELLLAEYVYRYARLIKLEPGRLEINTLPEAPVRFAQDLSAQLSRLSGQRWMVSVSGKPGQPTLAECAQNAQEREFSAMMENPAVRDVLTIFPGAKLTGILPISTEGS